MNALPITGRTPLANACAVACLPPQGATPGFAFVACREDGVFGIELKDPAKPAVRGALVAPGMDARKLQVDAQRLFVAAFGGGLHIYDIRNPNHPMPVSKLSSALIPYVENVFAWGSYVFLAGGDGVNARIAIVDVRNLLQPRIVGGFTYVTPEPTNYVSVGFDGRFAFAGTNKGELHVLDISNLGRVARAGEYFAPRHDFRPSVLSGIVALPGRVYAADWGQGLIVLDTRSPTNPRQIGIFQGGSSSSNAYRVALEGSYAYVANGWGGLLVVDVTSPMAMRAVCEVCPPRASFVDIAMMGPFAVIADNGQPQGLVVVRVGK